jgi:hypothetical protein
MSPGGEMSRRQDSASTVAASVFDTTARIPEDHRSISQLEQEKRVPEKAATFFLKEQP